MNTLNTMMLAGSVLLAAGGPAAAQTKTLQGEMITATATIESIDAGTRTLTIKTDKGLYETIEAPADIQRFNELKVGDKINARYYENVVIRMKKPGEAAVDLDTAALTRTEARPGVTAATQRTITVTVTAMDPKAMSVTVKGPNGYNYSRRMADKKAFEKLKVGDQLDMTWTSAVLIGVEK